MLSEDILYLPASELSRRIRARQLSPVELTESYLERSRQIGPKLNAYITLTPELAKQQAQAAEKEIAAGKYRGVLHGIPYAAKDLLAVKGYPTTWGARPYEDQHFDQDATVIRKLKAAGAVLIGKASMIELAGGMGYRFASASALGTETWGSIICPSGFCGISGLRPTFGRVSRAGAMALSYSMDKIGPMCRTAEDCDSVLRAISGHDPQDAGSLPNVTARYTGAATSPHLRLGWMINQWKDISPDVNAPVAAARK